LQSTTLKSSMSRRNTGAALAAVLGGTGLLVLSFSPLVGSAAPSPTTIEVSQNATWGPTLTLSNGDTLYRLSTDTNDHSHCTGKCATVWIPIVLSHGQKAAAGKGVGGLGSFARTPGVRQVTLDGLPLYRLVGEKPGQVGSSVDTWGRWWSINPNHPRVAPTKLKSGGSGGSGGTTTTTSPPSPPVTTTTAPPTTTTTSGGGIAY
jgi:predicted lipoprotein with Yx(FWY)xxD motif